MIPILVSLLAAEGIRKVLRVQTYWREGADFSSGLQETWQGVSWQWLAVEGLPGTLGEQQEGPEYTEVVAQVCSLASPAVAHHTDLQGPGSLVKT